MYFDQILMEIAPDKSKAIIFSPRSKLSDIKKKNLSFKINNSIIEIVNSTKYLGFYLDSKLDWKIHIKKTKSKVSNSLNIIKCVAGINWGSHPSILLNIYKGLIRSHLDWGSILFDKCDRKSKYLLDKIQFAALRNCLGVMRTTPTNIILDLAGEFPLEIRRNLLTKKFLIKISSWKKHPLLSLLKSIAGNESFDHNNHPILVDKFLSIKDYTDEILSLKFFGLSNFSFRSRFVNIDGLVDFKIGTLCKLSDNPNKYFIENVVSKNLDKTFFYTVKRQIRITLA